MSPVHRAALKEALEYGLICMIWAAAFLEFLVFVFHDSAFWKVFAFPPIAWWCVWRLIRWDAHHYESRNRAIEEQRKAR